MVRKRTTRSVDDLPGTRSVKRSKVEDGYETPVKEPSKPKRQKGSTPSRKRKPKSEPKSEQNGFLSASEESEIEVGIAKKQRVSNNTTLENNVARISDIGKSGDAKTSKEAKPTRKRGKKEISKSSKKLSEKTNDSFIDQEAVPPSDNDTSLPKRKKGIQGESVGKKHATSRTTRHSRTPKKSVQESTEEIKAKLDDRYDGTSMVSEWVKKEKPKDADSSGDESEDDIDWEDVQEAEGHHGEGVCDNGSISPGSLTTTKTENKNVEISIQIPGMKGKRKKKTEDDLLTKIEKAMTRFKKQVQLDMHKAHLVMLVAWGFNRNAMCNQPSLQAYCLSYIPSHLLIKSVKKWESDELKNFITWFKEDFPSLKQLKDDLSKNDMVPVASYPQNVAEVLVILLRSLGILTRLASSLQPVSMKISKDSKATTKKNTASKNLANLSNSIADEATESTPKGKLERVSQCENNLKDSNVSEGKETNTVTDNIKLFASSNCTVLSSSPSSSSKSKHMASATNSPKQNTSRKATSSTHQGKVRSEKEKNETEQKDTKSVPKGKKLRKHKKVNYAVDDDSGSDKEDQQSSYSEEKSNSESDEEFEKEKKYKAPKKPPPSKPKKRKTPQSSKTKKSPSVVEMIDDEEEFEVTSKPIRRRSQSRKSPVQILSDDSDEGVTMRNNKAGTDAWVEVYLPTKKSWFCIDVVSYSINEPELCEKYASKPISYVIAYDNENSIKDVTGRYASDWLSKTKKLRIDADWWEETLLPYKTRKKKMDEMEDSQLLAQHQERPLPQSITEYKSHPLYVLKRHLLKFEAIYPETAATLGFIRGEAVYSRDCVHLLHTREKWMSLEGRVVKQGEEPYKIVKGRMKRNQPVVDPSTVTIDLFGRWQTEDYKPPPVKDGKVPKNEYGNVELFKPSMLPPGSKHIQIPGIQKIAKKLGIDAAPAVVGFDFHCGFCHPVIDGLVVAKESVPALMDAWRQEQEQAEKRKEEKREKRVLGYWKQFVKSLLIRERLKRKYNTQESRTSSEQSGEQLEDEKIPSIAVSWPQNMKQGKTSVKDDGHCHVFPKKLHKKDKISGEWTKSCSCGFTLPLDK